jgi:hypothetical protein
MLNPSNEVAISRGDRVRSVESWSKGVVLRTNPASCVVRFDDGSERWVLRQQLERLESDR